MNVEHVWKKDGMGLFHFSGEYRLAYSIGHTSPLFHDQASVLFSDSEVNWIPLDSTENRRLQA